MQTSQQFFEILHEFLSKRNDDRALYSLPHVQCTLGTARGPVRDENQDCAIVFRSSFSAPGSQDFLLFVISDGIGGMAEGGACARLAVSAVSTAFAFSSNPILEERLTDALRKSNEVVFEKFRGKGGATLSLLLISKDDQSVTIGNVGDSRVYGFRPQGPQIVEQLTIDDTIEARIAQIPKLDQAEIAPELKGRLAQYIGMPEGLEPSIYIRETPPDAGEGYLLSTDGVHDISSETFNQIIINSDGPLELASRLLDVAEWTGGADNATAIAVYPDAVKQFLESEKVQRRIATIWSPYSQLDFGSIELVSQKNARENLSSATREQERPSQHKNQRKKKRKPNQKRNKQQRPGKLDSKLSVSDTEENDETQISIEFISEELE